MFISLQELNLKPVQFAVEVLDGKIDFENDIRQISPLRAEGQARLENELFGEIRVDGKVAVEMEAPCDRCLELSRVVIKDDFHLVYRPMDQLEGHGEDEIDDDEIDLAYYEGDRLEVEEILREVVLLALPMQVVCREACKGICPDCGGNRNQTDCQCRTVAHDDRWSKLKAFKVQLGPTN